MTGIWITVGYGFTLYVCIPWSYSNTTCNMPFDELVRTEAIFNSKVKKWWRFLRSLVLSTVICMYPYKCFYTNLILNLMLPDRVIVIQQKIEPCPLVQPFSHHWSKYTHSVFVKGLLPSSVTFKHNHYVPLIYGDVARKKKSSSSFPKSMKLCNVQFAWKICLETQMLYPNHLYYLLMYLKLCQLLLTVC